VATPVFAFVTLATPPVVRLVPDGVFDGFGWCKSLHLGWRRPAGALEHDTPVTSANPPGMVFVLHGDAAPFLPRELARLHVAGLGLADEWALAPWAIDDATDLLYQHRAPPGEAMGLATGSIAGLFWGLHDWAHFHNHGPFDERAWTELQCDAAALAWMWANRAAIGIGEDEWERVRRAVVGIGAERFAAEGAAIDEAILAGERVKTLVAT
jgi:hypothetical protein